MDLFTHVEISCVVGGYVVATQEWDAEDEEWKENVRAAITVEEALMHVRRTLEAVDRQPERAYPTLRKPR